MELPSSDQKVTAVIVCTFCFYIGSFSWLLFIIYANKINYLFINLLQRIDPEKCDKFSKREIVQMKRDLAATIGETIDNNPRASAWLLYDSILSSLRFKSPENEEIYKRMMATKIMFPNMPQSVFQQMIFKILFFYTIFFTLIQ